MTHNHSNDGPPRYREAVAAASELRAATNALNRLLALGPLQHSQWLLLDHIHQAMSRMQALLGHQPTREAMHEDVDGIALVLPLLSDPQLAQLLERLQRERPAPSLGEGVTAHR